MVTAVVDTIAAVGTAAVDMMVVVGSTVVEAMVVVAIVVMVDNRSEVACSWAAVATAVVAEIADFADLGLVVVA